MFAPQAGTLIKGNIRLDRSLGQGGMGHVWLADHLGLQNKVVVKFIADEIASNEEARNRFAREAAAAAQVRSPHVVQTYDHGITDDGTPFIVMEYLEGEDLGDLLQKEGALPQEMVRDVIGQLCRALEKAHQSGIIHRDVKPNNVFLVDAGSGELFVKLLDFGIAKGISSIGAATQTGMLMGSPYYMSPEQLMGTKDLDARSDLWAVGVMAYEALIGQRPFEGETVGALTVTIYNDPLPVPSAIKPSIPAGFDGWFARVCAKNRDERYASAKALSEALSEALSGRIATPMHSIAGGKVSPSSDPGKTPHPRSFLPPTAVDTPDGMSHTQKLDDASAPRLGVAATQPVMTPIALADRSGSAVSAPPDSIAIPRKAGPPMWAFALIPVLGLGAFLALRSPPETKPVAGGPASALLPAKSAVSSASSVGDLPPPKETAAAKPTADALPSAASATIAEGQRACQVANLGDLGDSGSCCFPPCFRAGSRADHQVYPCRWKQR
jgi:eukaryotic-like serine/threonine-protein kinase